MGFAIHWHESAMSVHLFPILNTPHLPPHPIPQGHPNAPALSTLSHALNLDWQSVSHMIIYTFQCYSLGSSHHHLLPQSPKDYSIHLCLFSCLCLYKIIYTEIGEKPDNGFRVPIKLSMKMNWVQISSIDPHKLPFWLVDKNDALRPMIFPSVQVHLQQCLKALIFCLFPV